MSQDYSKLFKAYDIRGTFPLINSAIYYWSGYALVETILKPENLPLIVNVMRDCRYTSPEFYQALCAGIKAAGGEPVLLGLGATDMLYAACQLWNNPGAMVTASHNPKDDNGLKIVKKAPQMLGLSTGLDKIRDFVLAKIEENGDEVVFESNLQEQDGLRNELLNYYQSKIESITDAAESNRKLGSRSAKFKVVVDTANGMGGLIMPVMQQIYPNVEFVPLYWELDGTFPNHPADPMVADNMKDLQSAVLSHKADLGIAFDGDGDRVFFVDEKGENLNGEYLVALVAKYMVEAALNKPELGFNPAVVYVVSYSRCLADTVLQAGGAAVVSKQGHTYIKSEMAKYNAIYGGEASGHHYFGEFGYMDSGAIMMAMMLKMLAENSTQVSSLSDYYKDKYYVSGERNFRVGPEISMDFVKKVVKQNYPDAVFNEMDGITLYYPLWKMTIRGSNTEPLLRINIETKQNSPELNPDFKLAEIKQLLGIS